MNNRHNSINDSIFSADYKISYSKGSIQSHLEESQQEINFIKLKLTEAYQKLELEIQNSNDLQDQIDVLKNQLKEQQEKYQYEKKQNSKLKETLEVILKNRKILQQQSQEMKDSFAKKISEKDKIIQNLQTDIQKLTMKCSSLVDQCEEKDKRLKQYIRQDQEKEINSQREVSLLNKIQILEQQINKITQEKYIEVNRLRHELQLYQRSKSAFIQEQKVQENKNQSRKREFNIGRETSKSIKYNTRTSQETQIDFNKQNTNSIQGNLTQSQIVKWKRPQSKECSNVQIAPSQCIISSGVLTDDEQLTLYQHSRKKAEQQLTKFQKIKRPNNEEREKMIRLERQIYHLDSDIAGLKRKIRRKY